MIRSGTSAGLPHVVVVGDHFHAEFRDPLKRLESAAQVTRASTLNAAIEALRNGPPCRLVIAAQARPGRFTTQQIEALHAVAPITPLVSLLGSWCEGGGRSDRPLPGVGRFYWHEWPEALAEHLTHSPAENARLLTLVDQLAMPPTEHSEEREPSGVLAVAARDHESFDALRVAVRCAGYAAYWQLEPPGGPLPGVEAVIWDAAWWDAHEQQRLAATTAVGPPTLLLLYAPRPQDQELARELGVREVAPKPVLLPQLFACLRRLRGQEKMGSA